jgi:galactose mutarotase-like enzyme
MGALAKAFKAPIGAQPKLEGLCLVSPSGRIRASVAPRDGGALSSLCVRGCGELLYRAEEFAAPPEGAWSGRAPLLWPAVGRNYPEPGSEQLGYSLDGRRYPMPIHGFARLVPWKVVGLRADKQVAQAVVSLEPQPAIQRFYPWHYRLEALHEIDDLGWSLTVTVKAPETIRFGLGNHLTLKLPAGDDFDRVVFASNASRAHVVGPDGLLTEAVRSVDLRAGVPLEQEWLLNTALGGWVAGGWAEVRYPEGPVVRITQTVNAGEGLLRPEDRLFVLWGSREQAFFCPEPWIGRPNGLQTGRGAVALPPATPFIWSMRVDIDGI